MKLILPGLMMICLMVLAMCTQNASNENDTGFPDSVRIQWRHIENLYREQSQHLGEMTIINEGSVPLPNKGWALYFNWFRRLITEGLDNRITGQHINGDFYEIAPTRYFPVLKPGESVTFPVIGSYYAINETDAPSGAYFTWIVNDEPQFLEIPVEIVPFDPGKCVRSKQDIMPVWSPADQYLHNEKVVHISISAKAPSILPTPVNAEFDGLLIEFSSDWGMQYAPECQPEAMWFQKEIQGRLRYFPNSAAERIILLQIKPNRFSGSAARKEAYRLTVAPTRIEITGFDDTGIFYGLQTLLALQADHSAGAGRMFIPACRILDYPRFEYRGMHVDVARNFHDDSTIKQLLDEMARFKLNRLHFHLTDDEGWRLEIPGLPELTELGAVRGHTLDETEHLVPSLGSGPYARNNLSPGNGYYSRDTYIDMLKYASERHIQVMPEIDLPGHAHAAITAMNARRRRLLNKGLEKEAYEFLLYHPEDTSRYESVQKWKNNAVDVGMESTYRFFEKVVMEVRKMYIDAGLELNVLHIGGDEVSDNAWSGSPACHELKRLNPDIGSNHDLLEYFVDRLGRILDRYDIRTAGWEEIGMQFEAGKKVPNQGFAHRGFIPYVWNSIWGWGGEDLAYRLANQGFDVVLSNATNLYFGLAYTKHPKEPGLYWAGFVNLRRSWEFTPTNIKHCAETDLLGRTVDVAAFDRFEPLDQDAEKHILGMQGHIWSENARSKDRLHYFVFPKLLGMAERAWSPKPMWEQNILPAERENEWNKFVTIIGMRELPRLAQRGIKFRIPLPGAVVRNDTLYMNNMFPGLTPVYQIDNNTPVEYQTPVFITSIDQIRILVWNRDSFGRESRKTALIHQKVNAVSGV